MPATGLLRKRALIVLDDLLQAIIFNNAAANES